MRASRILSLILLALLLGACGSDDSGGGSESNGSNNNDGGDAAQTLDVTASDFKFEPTSFSVDPGADVSVSLTNDGETAHTFTVSDPDFEVEAAAGASAEGTFTAPQSGTLEYVCAFHPDMKGTITVGDSAGAGGGEVPEDDKGPTKDY